MEWKRNGKGIEKQTNIIWNSNWMEWRGIGMEMEWKIINRKRYQEMEWRQNGNGMEKKKIDQVESNIDGMEWKGKGNGMEKVGEQ